MPPFGVHSGKGKMFLCHGNRQSRGVAILVSEKSGLDVKNMSKDIEGRWIKGEINRDKTMLSVASVYAPNEQYARSYFCDDVSDRITGDHNWIIGGDFNCNIDNSTVKDVSKTILKNVTQETDLVDTWRTIHPGEIGSTHYHKATKQASRIDYLFISSNLLCSVIDISVIPYGISDHHIVNMKLHDPNTYHVQGRWICNNSLLKDEDCNFRTNTFWEYWITHKHNYE